MNTYLLIMFFCIITLIAYLIVFWTFSMVKKIVDHFSQSLKGLFVLIGLIGSIWIFTNTEKAHIQFENIKNWNAQIKDKLTSSHLSEEKSMLFKGITI